MINLTEHGLMMGGFSIQEHLILAYTRCAVII